MRRLCVLVSALALILSATPTGAQTTASLIAGYEVAVGAPCTVAGQAATCGTSFVGWTGGTGPVPGGWAPLPGRGGAWTVSIDYVGTPGIGGGVTLLGGSWSLTMSGSTRSGTVARGTVTWPSRLTSDVGCGAGIAKVTAVLQVTGGGSGSVRTCLDDTHLATVFPPQIWGAFTLGPVGGAGLSLRMGPGGSAALSWQPGTVQSGYVVVRVAPSGVTLLPSGGSLPSSATMYADTPPVNDVVACYALVPLGDGGILGGTGLVCLLPQSGLGTNPAPDFAITLEDGQRVTLSWTFGPLDRTYVLVIAPLDGSPAQVLPVGPGQPWPAIDTGGQPTCFAVAAVADSTLLGVSPTLCALTGGTTL